MNDRRNTLLAAIAAFAAIGLTACTHASPAPTASPTSSTTSPTPSPVATSETPTPTMSPSEETVVNLLKTQDAVGKNPNVTLNVLAKYARGKMYQISLTTAMQWRAKGWVQKGDSTIISLTGEGSTKTQTIHACVDVSKVQVLDSKGKSVVQSSRKNRALTDYTVTQFADGWYVTDETSKGLPC